MEIKITLKLEIKFDCKNIFGINYEIISFNKLDFTRDFLSKINGVSDDSIKRCTKQSFNAMFCRFMESLKIKEFSGIYRLDLGANDIIKAWNNSTLLITKERKITQQYIL